MVSRLVRAATTMGSNQNPKSQSKSKVIIKAVATKSRKQGSTGAATKNNHAKHLIIKTSTGEVDNSLGIDVPLIDTSEGDVTITPALVESEIDNEGATTTLNGWKLAKRKAKNHIGSLQDGGTSENGVNVVTKSVARNTTKMISSTRTKTSKSNTKKGRSVEKITITTNTGKGKAQLLNEVQNPMKEDSKIVITSGLGKEEASQKVTAAAASTPPVDKAVELTGETLKLTGRGEKKQTVTKKETKRASKSSKKTLETDTNKKSGIQKAKKNSIFTDKIQDIPEEKNADKAGGIPAKKSSAKDKLDKDGGGGESSDDGMDIDIQNIDDDDEASSDATDFDSRDPNEEHVIVLKECESEVDENNKRKKFKCAICGKFSTAKADLLKHVRIHTGERPFKCKICNATFVQITALRGHETIHTGEKPFTCDICMKSFALKDRLRLHMRVHTGEKPHKCNKCNQAFARRSQVTQHLRVHTGEKAYECAECGARFTSYHTLKGHLMAHRGVKEFQCGACGKKFIRVEGLYKHIRMVHRGSRPYYCNLCGKAFKGHLQQHMRLHLGVRPFECSTCKATFTQNSQLTVHMRIHTGERPYKCQICGAAFAHSSACKIHMRSHTGEKPFQCVLCSAAFSQLPHLKKHMKCVHNAVKPYLCTICKDFFQTQSELDGHERTDHGMDKSAEQEAEEMVEESTLARLRNRLAVLLYRISSEERRCKFGFGHRLVDEVLKLSLESSGHVPINDKSLSRLDELRKNVLLLLKWTIPKDTLEEYHKNNMTVDEVLDMLTT
ncbi:hypothetical protein OTU49_007711 [Cherax quadricarinatus]|uniref:C2H2-type domain-containing protein n=1 Tax=Cherax quadricarinatus TaxID=27406 RepID=A0AAW0WFX0_CHEQU|nr:zinc finger protein 37-like [Cherax quadricarinatus]